MSNNNSNSFHPPPPPPPVPGADSGRLPPPPPPPPPSLSRPNMSTNPILSPLPPPPLPASARIPTTTTPMKNKNRNSGMDESDYDDAKIASGVGTKLPHSVHSAMPSLVSAPTSANISFDDIASKLMTSAASNSTEILQGAVEFFNAATGDSARDGNNAYWSQPTTVSGIPPPSSPTRSFPPPPPPPPSLRPATTGSYTSSTTNPFSATVVPLPPLPPPPQIGSATKERPGSTLSPLSAATSAETEEYGPPRPSTSLPYTQFRPKEPQPLSASQTSIPVLIIATESAHRMAWKNGLYISDMFEGLAQKNLINVSSGGQSSTATLPPFRSATRSLTMLTWDDLASITFTEPELIASAASLCTADQAAFKLQNAVVLQESDGNLQHELAVLEDQIDNLLYDDSNSGGYGFEDGDDDNYGDEQARDQNTGSSSDLMSKYQRIQRRQEQAYKDAYQLTSPMNIPWLWRYRLALDESTTVGGQQHEMFSCPAVILTICTTAEEMNPFETLSMLQNQQFYLPPLYYKNGLFDPTAVRHEVLVLHDNVQGPKNWDESALRSSLQRKYGPCASVVRINSIPPETAQQLASEETSDLWGGGGKLGNCLSVGDRATIRKYLTQFVQAAILPALERRIADLNTIVSDRKKGVKNVLKSLWGGGRQAASSNRLTKDSGVDNDDYNNSSAPTSGSGATATTSGTILYRYDSIESQTRLLGDTLFLMKDYDAALSMYRLIKEDFKQDNTWTHYGSIQEIIAMCLYYIDPYRNAKEIFASIESALLSYNRAASDEIKQQQMDGDFSSTNTSVGPGERAKYATLSTRLATRLCLVLASVRNISTGRNLEVADLLASASSGETSLGAAVLLEQSSAHYYKTEMFRKYAFHMLMSGHMFRSAMSADHHAFRCFTSALHIYNGSGNDGKWEELQNHLRSSLASLLFSMGRMAVALQLYAKLLGTTNGGRVSVKSQQKFISNLLEICNDHRKKALAGVDRMAASSSKYISAEERDRVRKAHLDRIVQVIQYTKSASRVLEIPNMDLPLVHDSTVSVIAEEEVHNQQDDNTVKPHFGEARVGSSEVWDDLMLWTLAELKAAKAGAKENISIGITTSDEVAPTIQKALQKIEDDDIRRVVMLVEKEKANRAMAERTRRRGKITQSPPVRAQMEPIAVEFDVSNPLGIPIDVNDLQLVAKMTTTAPEQHLQRLCTNEDPVFIKPLASFNERKKWKFQNSTVQYEVADFCRVSSSASIKSGDTKKESWKSADDTDPFFVVTKSNYTIQQECKMRISVSICPLVQGNLEILGIRYRLLDNVWVYHPFDIKGPLLQNTRSNRANRIRGESFLLKSKVERGMPCISVDVIPRVTRATPPCSESSRNDNGPVLQGEIGKWTLRVSNVGTAPASRISLKTNVPWITIDDCNHEISTPGDVTANERNATSYCVGPTGTLLHLPIDVFGKDNLKVLHEIQPGETIDIPVGIRTSGGVAGKQDLYMLFRYELPISEEGNQMGHSQQTSRFRWFKKMFEVPVYPSLSLSASIMPAFSSAHGEHILTLELTNGRIDRPDKPDIMLNTIALASRHYKLEAIPGQLASSGDNKSGFQLRWQERANIHYRIVLKERATSQQLLSECALSTIQQEEKSADKSMISSSLLGFICLERAHSSFEEALGIYQMALSRAAAQSDDGNPRTIAEIRRANTPGDIGTSSFGYDASDNLLQASTTVHTTSIERLCPADGFNTQLIQIFCTWSDVDQLIVGEHHIRDFPIIKPFASGTKHGCPITVSADHPTVISNDFTIGPAVIPLHVTLRNRLAEGVASNAIQVEFSVEQPDNFDFVSYPQDGYRRTLRGGEELSIPLKAMLPYAGVYNVQKLRLTTVESGATSSFGEPQPIVYHFPQQWMVTARSI